MENKDKKTKVFTYVMYGIIVSVLLLGGVAGMSGDSSPSSTPTPAASSGGSW